jgi:uncharacterized membrane protein
MESRVKIAGHPLHQMLIVFPLGLLAAGVLMGLLAAAPGWVDWAAIPTGTRAKRVGLMHGVGNVIVLGLFLLSWVLRRHAPEAPPTEAIVAGLAGAVLALGTAWLGGELVDRLGVGVDDGAHLDAPSSLTAQPASVRPRGYDRRAYPSPAYAGVERRVAGSMR